MVTTSLPGPETTIIVSTPIRLTTLRSRILSKLPASIPDEVVFGEPLQSLYVAEASVTGVVAPVAMDFQTPSCLLTLEIPDDIVAMSNTVLKKMVVKASEDHPLTSDIAYEATL